MKKIHLRVLVLLLIAAGSFLAGSWVTHQGSRGTVAERKILHYVDPMNPALKFDKPGIAPCGMPLEPVYADQEGAGATALRASLPPGTIRIAPEKQQLTGVKTAAVEKIPWSHTLRVLGRVAPDETLVYRVNAAVNGWIEEVLPVTTGSLVKEDELLATFYSLEYRNLVQNYFNLITISKEGSPGAKAVAQGSKYSVGQLRQLREAASSIGQAGEGSQIDYYRKNLLNYGMSAHQIEEMERTKKVPETVEIRAPSAGFVLYRNVSPGLRFDRGAEFFRIADLSRVWILADLFETEASHFRPGLRVKMELPYQKRTLHGVISTVLPQFDPATRTLKVRIVADNPGYAMRPDMFVNVELPASGPPAILVPVDAVLDSGLKKTVFVDRGNGYFEPRLVETGQLLGEQVEIVRGLMAGEKIVVSGNFLIDSEARMQQAASGIAGRIGRDPVCGMNIDEDLAKTAGNMRTHKDKGYFFCSPECRDEFGKDPERYLKSAKGPGTTGMTGSGDAAAKHDHPLPEAAPPSRGTKATRGGHEGMAMPMPGAEPPRAMPGKPPTAGTMPGRMSMPKDAAPLPEMKDDMMAPSPGSTPEVDMDSPALPGPEEMTMTGPQEAAPMLGAQPGAPAPRAPMTRTPRINPRLQRYLPPGAMPKAAPQGEVLMPGEKTGTEPAPAIDSSGSRP
ncbi:MAG: efflux RND transporter periplasmic adaptor subunit [Deltaproteobacteria bacterium]|nr:efflux RND transporter periplasmic adaptor subunit [Deltaproteobacteria bacterium]